MTLRTPGLSRLFALLVIFSIPMVSTATNLADQPIYSSINVAGNLVLPLSVEFPTALSSAYSVAVGGQVDSNNDSYATDFSPTIVYQGMFDPAKCYQYNYTPPISPAVQGTGYFSPASTTTAPATCNGSSQTGTTLLWSGNFLNWATAGTLDIFRQVLTGGYRSVDTASQTIVEKAWGASPQFSSSGNFPTKVLSFAKSSSGPVTPYIPAQTKIQNFNSRVYGIGNRLYFSVAGTGTSAPYGSDYGTSLYKNYPNIDSTTTQFPTDYDGHNLGSLAADTSASTVYALQVRVQVCNAALGLESNYTCTGYPSPVLGPNFKPEGLIQQYANKIRFSVLGYLNNNNDYGIDAGVLRAKMDFVGPTRPSPFNAPIANTAAEWSSTTGVFTFNPVPADASATGSNLDSGVVNYLNKFGEAGKSYKTWDPVSELFYAAIRYYRGLPNVAAWSSSSGAGTSSPNYSAIDGFPVITNWGNTDVTSQYAPIQYSCQKSFILGIGDDNTHADSNVPGTMTANASGKEPSPNPVTGDTTNGGIDTVTSTNMVGKLEAASGDPLVTSTAAGTAFGNYINNTLASKQIFGPTPGAGNAPTQDDSTFAIAGLAYNAHTVDQRPNDFQNTDGSKNFIQTIATYWLDVQFQGFDPYNQFWLAAKYGGFTVPANYQPYAASTAPPPLSAWSTANRTYTVNPSRYPAYGSTQYPSPDNYFSGGDPVSMKNGLTAAFTSIATNASISALTSSFAVASQQIAGSGGISYASSYQSGTWVGDVVANTSTFDSSGNLTSQTQQWDAQALLDTQAATVVTGTTTVNGWDTKRFIATSSSAASSVGVAFRSSTATTALGYSANLISYLRGDHSNELSKGGIYRNRVHLLGDIVDSSLVAVSSPNGPYSDSNNPGYSSFKSSNSTRPTVVYVGANDGFLHAFDGTIGSTGGKELFAYMPSQVLSGPSTPATPTVDGAASLSNNPLVHHYLVDATPVTADVDFNRAGTPGTASTTANWHTILVGGLGKGGKSYYALDITSAQTANESAAVARVLWEFTDSDMGFTYGPPIIVKTAQYGWVVIVTSGYNNTGLGYLYILNAKTGAQIQKISTGTSIGTVGSLANPSGLAYASAFVNDYTSYTTDAVYAGDLLGNLWRFDLTKASGPYPAPALLATLADSSGNAQPVTTTPGIQVDPSTLVRYVTVGTGQLLASTDSGSSKVQTFYAFKDGTATATAPYVAGATLTRSSLTNDTASLATGYTSTSTSSGFYVDLPVTNGVAAKIVIPPVGFQNVVAFATSTPNTTDPCNPGGSSQSYVVNLKNGLQIATTTYNGSVNSLGFYNVSGHIYVEVGLSAPAGGGGGQPPPCTGQTTCKGSDAQDSQYPRTRFNWREIPLTN